MTGALLICLAAVAIGVGITVCLGSPFADVGGTVAALWRRLTGHTGRVDAQLPTSKGANPEDQGGRLAGLIIDASRSMLAKDWPPSRLGAGKDAALRFIRRLADKERDARVFIIAFGDTAKLCCRALPVTDLAGLESCIKRIRCMGSTNVRAALRSALHQLQGAMGPKQVVLLTDGHNTGSCPRAVAESVRQLGILECVGIGGSPDEVEEELLREIASVAPNGSKRYRWIGDKEGLVAHFEQLAGRIVREP
jgi:Mg-chelatase subunit ChlD